jgi:hypothetical protein
LELPKIVGGPAVIAANVVSVGLDLRSEGGQPVAAKPAERSFASGANSARFVMVATE